MKECGRRLASALRARSIFILHGSQRFRPDIPDPPDSEHKRSTLKISDLGFFNSFIIGSLSMCLKVM